MVDLQHKWALSVSQLLAETERVFVCRKSLPIAAKYKQTPVPSGAIEIPQFKDNESSSHRELFD